MGIPSFFKIPRHKQFNYEPLYYVRSLTRGSFSHYYERKRKTQRYSTTRLIIIMIFLLFVAYYLFFV